jgi:hypothetical protein
VTRHLRRLAEAGVTAAAARAGRGVLVNDVDSADTALPRTNQSPLTRTKVGHR